MLLGGELAVILALFSLGIVGLVRTTAGWSLFMNSSSTCWYLCRLPKKREGLVSGEDALVLYLLSLPPRLFLEGLASPSWVQLPCLHQRQIMNVS